MMVQGIDLQILLTTGKNEKVDSIYAHAIKFLGYKQLV